MNMRHIALACLLGLAGTGLQAQAPDAPDLTAFINGGGLQNPRLSPNGERLAGMVRTNSVRALVTQNIDGSDREVVFAENNPDAALDFVRWVSNDRVLLRLTRSGGAKLGAQKLPVGRLISIQIDAKRPLAMSPPPGSAGLLSNTALEGGLTCPSSPFVTVRPFESSLNGALLVSFDARSGEEASRGAESPSVKGALRQWWSDNEGRPRLFRFFASGKAEWQWLPTGSKSPIDVDWPALANFSRWQLLGFDAQPDQVLVLAQKDATWQVLRVNVNDTAAPEIIATLNASLDDTGLRLVRNEATCQAIGLQHGDSTQLWGDNLQPFWGGLAKAVPGAKLELLQWQGDRVLVRMSEAGVPTRYLLGSRSARKLDMVADSYGRLPFDLGLTLRTFELGQLTGEWLQRTDAIGPLPTVVCVACELDRPGPDGSYRPVAAYLAHRGFGVLRLKSSNDGLKPLLEASADFRRNQSALLNEAVQRGWSDVQRVAVVAGESNSAWVVMRWASQHKPALRAVAVSGVVSDMGRLVYRDILGGTFVSEGTKEGYRRLIGPATEAELTAASPLAFVPTWQAPLLLVHAESHGSVGFQHSVRLADALKAAGKPVTLLRLPNTAQDVVHPPYRAQVLQAIDDLLAPLLTPTP